MARHGAPRQASPSEEIRFSRGRTVLYAAVATLLGLAVIEGFCAIIWSTLVPGRLQAQLDLAPVRFGMVNFPDIVEKDPWLLWRLKANSVAPLNEGKMIGFIANGDHMRNPEVPVERGPDDFRVLCLGDSITFGWGVRYEDAYPTLLAEHLRQALPDRKIHVLNAACSGYSIYQGFEMMRRRGLKYRPDVVTIWFGWNEKHVWDGMTDPEQARLFAREHLLNLSATYRVLSYLLRRSDHERVREKRKETKGGLPRVPVAEFQERLQEMVEMARANAISPDRGARVVLIQGCFRDQIRSAQKHEGRFKRDRYQKTVAEVAEGLGVPMLSVCDVLREAGLGKKVFLDPGHLDPKGLRAVADALFDLLAEHDMLPAPVAAADARVAGP